MMKDAAHEHDLNKCEDEARSSSCADVVYLQTLVLAVCQCVPMLQA